MNKVLVIRLLYFLVFCCTASWLPVMADFCKNRGLSGTETSLILAITPVMMFFVQPFYGFLADKYGFKKTLISSSFLCAFSYLSYLYNASFAWLIFTTIAMSIFYNTIQPILDSLSLQVAKADPKFSYGKIRIAGATGWAFTGVLIGQIIDKTNIDFIFIVSFISMALFFAFCFFLENDTHEKINIEESSFQNIAKIIQNKQLIILLLCVFVISAGTSTIWYFYSTYMKENGASSTLVGYGLSLQGLCELPFFYYSAKIINRFGLKTTFVITILSIVIRLVLYSIIENPVMALPIELLQGISWSLFWVVCVEYVNKMVDIKWLATGQSLLYVSFYGIGTIVGNFWTGYLADTNMRITEIFMLNAGIVFLVGIFVIVFLKNQKMEVKNT